MPPTRLSMKNGNPSDYCPDWLHGPQVSDVNASYSVGGPTWIKLNNACLTYFERVFSNHDIFYTPTQFFDKLVKGISETRTSQSSKFIETINGEIDVALTECHEIYDVIMIFSVFVLTYGEIKSRLRELPPHRRFTNELELLDGLVQIYDHFYEGVKKILEKPELIDELLVLPEDFINLDNQRQKRTKNFILLLKTSGIHKEYELIKSGKIPHPISREMQKCNIDLKSDCTDKFKNVKNDIFEPLAKVFGCYCSFFKIKLIKSESVTNRTLYGSVNEIKTITAADYEHIRLLYSSPTPSQKPTILINKYRDNEDENKCSKKTYLSQLFSKVCSILYEPYIVKPSSSSKDDIIAASRANIYIGQTGCTGYAYGNLNVFHTRIEKNNNVNDKVNVPIMFLKDNRDLYLDWYRGPTVQFFTDVLQELVDLKVFIPTETFFNNQRYELNTKFNIETLECYSKLSSEIKTAEFKKEITDYFYLFIGNLIHFAVANNIEIPFKLSRLYIMKLFNIYDFTKPEIFGDLKLQLLLISLFLLEKAPNSYTATIIQILENPKEALVGNPNIFAALDPAADSMEGSIQMNGYSTILPDDEDRDIYSENETTLFYNIVEYLYKTSLKAYFEDINSLTPVTDKFKMHPHLELFFKGFTSYKEFHAEEIYYSNLQTADFNITMNSQQKLAAIRKLDVYLSGFGITHDVILNNLIPKILIKDVNLESYVSIITKLGRLNTSLMPTDLEYPDFPEVTSKLVRPAEQKTFWLFRILLNKGKNISTDFIKSYNKKFFDIPIPEKDEDIIYVGNMTQEDYHNEFVKILLKTWSGIPSISTKFYKIHFIPGDLLPSTHTCFLTMDFRKNYTSPMQLYKDLVILVTEGSNFGELLAGGSKQKKLNKKLNKTKSKSKNLFKKN